MRLRQANPALTCVVGSSKLLNSGRKAHEPFVRKREHMSKKHFILLSAALLMFSVASNASTIGSIVVYGDSLSDNGNLFAATGQPGSPYYMGRRSNGPVAVEQLATSLGATLVDFAWSGATTGIGNLGDGGTPTSLGADSLRGMLTQLQNSQSSLSPYLGGLFIVWGGPDDFLSPSPLDPTVQQQITRAVGDLVSIVDTLEADGATNILVPGMPDLGLTPYFNSLGPAEAAQATALTNAFNAALLASLPAGVKYFDTSALLQAMVSDPSAYGFTNVTAPCYNGVTVCSDPAQYLFYDDLHPTTEADAFLAAGFEDVVTPEPGLVVPLGLGLIALALAAKRCTVENKSPCRDCKLPSAPEEAARPTR